MRHQIPQPPDAGIVNALRFGTDTFRFLDGIQARFEDITAVPIPGRAPLVVVTNPRLVHDMLSRPSEFSRIPAQGSAARIAEQGLVQSEGALWRQQRSIMGPAFTGKQIRAYANTVGDHLDELVTEWSEADGDKRNLHRELTSLTIRVASDILLGQDIGRDRAEQFHEWMQVAGAEFEFSPTSVAPNWLPQPTSEEFEQAAEGVRDLADEIIDRRRSTRGDEPDGRPPDMLGLLLQAGDDPSVDYPQNQIRDEVATFLIAGHETTALSLTYTLSLLSWHDSIRQQVCEEAETVLGDDTPRYEHIADLAYTGHVYGEGLRLYPPAWAVFREATATVRLGSYRVENGSAVVIPLWSIHRDQRYFDSPLAFDPGRWDRRTTTSTDAYLPFSTGPHACIGRQFAVSGASLVLARLTQEFEIDVPPHALDDLRASVTLRPKDGVPATIRRTE